MGAGPQVCSRFCILTISDSVNGPLGRDTTHGQKAGDSRNGDADGNQQRDLAQAEIHHGDKQTDFIANAAVDQGRDNTRTDGGKGKVDHGDDERLREEDAEDVVTARTDGAQNADLLLFIGDAGTDEIGQHERGKQRKEDTDPNEHLGDDVNDYQPR